MTKLTNPLKSAICNRTERFSRMRRQNAPMLPDISFARDLQIVIVHDHGHGGVRESQPGYSESQIAIWSMLFFKISVTSKNVINLIIRTNKHSYMQMNRRVYFTGHGSRVTGHRSQVAGHGSQVAGHRSRVTDLGLFTLYTRKCLLYIPLAK